MHPGLVATIEGEAFQVREWTTALRIITGGRDAARAIEWAKTEHALEPTRPSRRRLSDFLREAYGRLERGESITSELKWVK